MGFGPLGVDALRLDQLRRGAVEIGALGVRERAARRAGERLGGRDAHAPDRIAEERRNEPRDPAIGGHGLRSAERPEPHERIGVGERALDDRRHRGRRELTEVGRGGGARDAGLTLRSVASAISRRRGVREPAPRGVERAGEVRRSPGASRPRP